MLRPTSTRAIFNAERFRRAGERTLAVPHHHVLLGHQKSPHPAGEPWENLATSAAEKWSEIQVPVRNKAHLRITGFGCWCRLDLTPPLADRFIFGVAPIDYGPVLLLMPFGFHLTMDTLPSGDPQGLAPGPPWLYPAFAFVPV